MKSLVLLFFLNLTVFIECFVPHPVIRFGGQAGESITHTEMTQLGFIRSLAQYFLDTLNSRKPDVSHTQSFQREYTIDELYKLIHPDWTEAEVNLYSYPVKSILDQIQVRNAVVDLNPSTKALPSAHFDDESFTQSNERIINLRHKVIEDVKNSTKDLAKARARIGDLLHTLQDFYSHSNWIEMGQKEINQRIGIEENIGRIAAPNQATCSSDGCQKLKSKCNLLQSLILKNCPMEYYDCKNNIIDSINHEKILTSGYVSAKGEKSTKPVDVDKCSHGSVMDATSYLPPVGGINKDTMTPTYSPHYHLHFEAVKLAIEATTHFFNELRREIGNENFDRLFAINPTEDELKKAAESIKKREKFHFLSSTLSIGLSTSDMNFQKTIKERVEEILHMLFGWTSSNSPTYDLTDQGISDEKVNVHGSSITLEVGDSLIKNKVRHFRRRKTRSKSPSFL